MTKKNTLRMFGNGLVLLCGFLVLANARPDAKSGKAAVKCQNAKTLIATFDPTFAGGVSGFIKATYLSDKKNPMATKIQTRLDVSKMNLDAIKNMYPKCSYPNAHKTFTWHLHVRWSNTADSGFLEDCSPDRTGGHYDSTFACGPASQYIKDVTCTTRQPSYTCNPETYKNTGTSCEMGDFSGKFGPFIVNGANKIISDEEDFFFPPHELFNKPMYLESNVKWNFLLHLNCPEHGNPRVLCARAKLE